ncbi:MAG: MFS transporter [Rhodospirillaceae bacterium]
MITSSFAEFKQGWKVLLGAIVGVGSGLTGIVFYTHGVFVVPITEEMGWSRGATLFAFSFVMMSAAITAPFIGIIIDKYGARRLALFGLFALGFSFAGLSLTTDNILTYYALWIFMALIAAGTFPVTWTRAVNTWFDRRRGLALGLTMMGTGIAASLGPLFAAKLIDAFGWREAYLTIGATLLMVSFPIAYVGFRERDAVANDVPQTSPKSTDIELRQALAGKTFWVLGFGLLFVCFGVAGLIANLVPLLTDKGLPRAEAAGYAGLIGINVIIGRLVVGYLIDRFWAPFIAFFFLILPSISCILLAVDQPTAVGITIACLLIGLAAGAELDVMAFLISRYFGIKNYGQLYGGLYVFFAVGSGAAPALFGLWYDIAGNYTTILYGTAVLFVAGSSMLLLMGPYPNLEEELI